MVGRCMKNVLVVSSGFLLLFSATGSLLNLQSSLNAEDGLGVASASVQFASIILSSVFLAPLVIRYLGCKWTIVASMGCNVVYTLGNFFPGWGTLIPTSVVLGLGEAPLWSATSTYLTLTGQIQARQVHGRSQDIINQYFGILFLLYQSSAVWGNLMSSLVLGQNTASVNITEEDLQFCGVSSCMDVSEEEFNSSRPGDALVHTLMGCYLGVGVLATLLVAAFLDNIGRGESREAGSSGSVEGPEVRSGEEDKVRNGEGTFCSTFLATFRQLGDRRQVLLIPITSYIGLELGFLNGEYTKDYVTCALGIHFVGYVMICFGATSSLSSYLFGRLSQYTGRVALFTLAAVTNLSCILALLFWRPHPDQLPVFFVFPALWGMADAVWQTQTNALYGVLFHGQKEAAFANYRLWEAVGYVVAFACSSFLCVDVKLYVLLAALLLAVTLGFAVEYGEFRKPTPSAEQEDTTGELADDGNTDSIHVIYRP